MNRPCLIQLFVGVSTALFLMQQTAWAYKEPTHGAMSAGAANQSILSIPDRIADLGLAAMDDGTQRFPDSEGNPKTIVKLIEFGATFEDSGWRSVNHFFDPYHDQPLTVGFALGYASPDWALEDHGPINGLFGVAEQKFSYRDGRQYFYDALTKPAQADRDKNWGLTFQTIGHVVHPGLPHSNIIKA